ncbi:DMT family transporter [Phenylobacterium sp. J367]|uniref:DMT family transporter n=1 Tax=Phenylobacterium sp. J367 TaxID=2898435 RepID=UPI002150C097|nr:EamA family transporter [Phenylobacterium sp. J367]MCR5877265.1 EamA family transporter [Phenylobacterium sp. J367]
MSSLATQNMALGIAYRVLAMACMACLAAIVKWTGSRGVPVFEIILFRNAFAFVPLGLYIWRTTGFEVLKTDRPVGHLIRSAIGLTGMVCGFTAVQHLPLTEATALQFASPLFMTALSALILAEPVGRHRWGAVIVGFVGVLIMARPQPGHFNLIGVSLGLASALGAAGAMVAIRQIADTERGPTIVFYFTLAGTVLGLLGSLAFGWIVPDPLTLTFLILAGLIGGVGQLFLTEALRQAPVGVVAPFDYTQLLWAAVIGLLVWGSFPGRRPSSGRSWWPAAGSISCTANCAASARAIDSGPTPGGFSQGTPIRGGALRRAANGWSGSCARVWSASWRSRAGSPWRSSRATRTARSPCWAAASPRPVRRRPALASATCSTSAPAPWRSRPRPSVPATGRAPM